MIAFVSIAVLMVAIALVAVLLPLLKPERRLHLERDASNLAILRDQLRELQADAENSAIPPAQYEQAKRELERRALEESAPSPSNAQIPSAAGAWTAAILAGSLPVAATLLYLILGSREAFSPAATTNDMAQHDLSPEKIEAMVNSLAARLEKEPNNGKGWAILANSYYSMNRITEAVAAYEHAVALDPDNADLLADYADALGAQQNGLDGKPLEVVQRALQANPTQWKALALAGSAAFDRKDYKTALAYWEKLRASLPADSGLAKSIDGSIAEAKSLAGIALAASSGTALAAASPPIPAAAPKPLTTGPAASAATALAGGANTVGVAATSAMIAGQVSISPAFAAQAAPDDTVFVFARAADGPRMPLAIIRKQVKDLPIAFKLDDSMAMAPQMKLSNFDPVVVGARISKSGNAMPQAGDLEGYSAAVKVCSKGVTVVIDTPHP